MKAKAGTFKRGGVLAPGWKLSMDSPIEEILPVEGEQLCFALAQHIGEPLRPVVKTGRRVLRGQKIADGNLDSRLSAPVHSSVSGAVLGFTETMLPNGAFSGAIVIENDGEYEEEPAVLPKAGQNLSPEQVLSKIRGCGVVGLGGAGYPCAAKLAAALEEKIDHIIINAAECEPYLTNDHRLLTEEREKLLDGAKILTRLFPKAKCILAVENISLYATTKLIKTYENSGISVFALAPKYPQGYEKQLVSACTGREIPIGALPIHAGVLVHNAATVIAISEAVSLRKPLTHRVITLSGGAVKRRGNFKVPIGLSFAAVAEAAGGFSTAPAKYIFGGPMMGAALHDIDVPVTKTSSGLICLTKKEARLPAERSCIRCGKCVGACPIGLMPLLLNSYSGKKDEEMFIRKNGRACVECGCCTYICPAKRHLTQSIAAMKDLLRKEGYCSTD